MNKGWIPACFSIEDIRLAEQVGSSRMGAKQAVGIRSELRRGSQVDTQGHINSFAAEMALARLLGVKPDTNISIRGNKGVHLTMGKFTFNAKYISNPTWDVRFSPDRIPEATICVLVTGELPVLWLVGAVSRKTFMEKAEVMDFGYGPRLVLPQSKLSPMSDMVNFFGLELNEARMRQEYERREQEKLAMTGSLFTNLVSDHAT